MTENELLRSEIASLNQEMSQVLSRAKGAEKGIKTAFFVVALSLSPPPPLFICSKSCLLKICTNFPTALHD